MYELTEQLLIPVRSRNKSLPLSEQIYIDTFLDMYIVLSRMPNSCHLLYNCSIGYTYISNKN